MSIRIDDIDFRGVALPGCRFGVDRPTALTLGRQVVERGLPRERAAERCRIAEVDMTAGKVKGASPYCCLGSNPADDLILTTN